MKVMSIVICAALGLFAMVLACSKDIAWLVSPDNPSLVQWGSFASGIGFFLSAALLLRKKK